MTIGTVSRSEGTRSDRLRVPLTILVTLWAAILACAWLMFGFTDRSPAPLPAAIWHPGPPDPASGEPDGPWVVTLTRKVNLDRAFPGGRLHLVALDRARLAIDGQEVLATASASVPVEAELPRLEPGVHMFTVTAERQGRDGAVMAFADVPGILGGRLVTDAAWNAANGSAAPRMASVVGEYGSAPFGTPFGPIPDSVAIAKGWAFWAPLLGLLVSMAVACLAGPVLRPPDRTPREVQVGNLGIVVPSIVYGVAVCLVTSLRAADAGPGIVVALQVIATAIFVLALVAWKRGTVIIEQDHVLHRAELAGYDSIQRQVEILQVSLQEAPVDFRQATIGTLSELAEAIRFSSTGTATGELDAQILARLTSMGADLEAVDRMTSDEFRERCRVVLGLVRRREVLAQSARRA